MSLKPSPTFLRLLGLFALFTIAPISLYILYARTGGLASARELTFQRDLRFALMADSATVDLAPLTDWPWIKVCAIDTGASRDELNAVVGFAYRDYDDLHWLPLKPDWTLLFIDSQHQVSWGLARPVVAIRIPRKEVADLALPDGVKGQCLDRSFGRIEVTRQPAPVGTSPVTLHFAG